MGAFKILYNIYMITAQTSKQPKLVGLKEAAKAKAKVTVVSPAGNDAIVARKINAITMAVAAIEKKFGKGSIMKMGDSAHVPVAMVPTGIPSLDIALGGGIPRGRLIEIFGPESSGKTTLASHIVAKFQKAGGLAAYIDAEHAFDPEYAAKLGVDIDNLLMSQPDTGEQALEICETLVRSNAVDIVAIDSVAALVPRAEIEGEMGASHVGLQARLMSHALRKIAGVVSKSHTTVIFINQLRMKIGVMFGNPETTSGGMALKFYSTIRLDIRRIGKIDTGAGDTLEVTGNRTRVKVVKNKVAPPFKVSEFDIMFNRGISREGDIIDTGVKHNIVRKSGAFYTFGDETLGQGRENAKRYLIENPKVTQAIEAGIWKAVKETQL
jgi:recombination protein RecA